MVESDIVLLYIWSDVWGTIHAVGPSVATVQTPPPLRGLFPVTYDSGRSKTGALSMHAMPPTIRIVCGTHVSDSPIRAS
jgi:hypothetical protein